jgi:hypothetical protein
MIIRNLLHQFVQWCCTLRLTVATRWISKGHGLRSSRANEEVNTLVRACLHLYLRRSNLLRSEMFQESTCNHATESGQIYSCFRQPSGRLPLMRCCYDRDIARLRCSGTLLRWWNLTNHTVQDSPADLAAWIQYAMISTRPLKASLPVAPLFTDQRIDD